jgi:hypothetical protein
MADMILWKSEEDDAFVKNREDRRYLKYAGKLGDAFRDFLVISKRGLEKHGQWVRENPAFRMLQDELESRYVLQSRTSHPL